MDLMKIMEAFPTQAACIAYLERPAVAGLARMPAVCIYTRQTPERKRYGGVLGVGIAMTAEQPSR